MISTRRVVGWMAVALLLGAFGSPRAETFRVRSFIRPAQGITDTRPVQFVVEVEGSTQPQLTAPRLDGLENLQIIGGPSTNSNFVWSNGRATSTLQLIYTLLAEGPGAAAIPGLEITIEGDVYRTEPIRFQVQDSPNVPPGSRAAPSGAKDEAADVYLQATLGSEEVWVGQAVPLLVELVTAPRISSPVWRQQPDLDDFWVETIDVNPDEEAHRRRVSGRVYTIYPIEKKILIPLSPGKFEFEPYVAQMQVRLSGNDLFDIFSRSRSQMIVRRSEPLTIHVKDLPSGKPAEFDGAVGQFSMAVDIDRAEAVVNDAVALRVKISGDGSLRSIGAPRIDAPPGINLFEPQLQESVTLVEGSMTAAKTWEWIIVPLVPGELELPEVRFGYFDPQAGEYRVASGQPSRLVVERGEDAAEGPLARGSIRAQRRELAFIKPLRGELAQGGLRANQRALYWLLLVAPLALLPLWIVVGRQQARLQRDRGRVRARKARNRARKSLKSAGRKLDQTDAESFHEEVARALVGYVADRFNRVAAGMTYDLAEELLGSRGVDPALRRRFRSCLESCDFARFVPAAGKTERRTELLAEAQELIEQLERAL